MSDQPIDDTFRQDLQARLASVHQRIDSACARAGRDSAEVRLLPVTKTVAAEKLRVAAELGCHEFGENKVQEAMSKVESLADLQVRWSIIGHLQRNKARQVARFAHELQSLDSLKLATALDDRLQREGRSLDVFVQVNSSGESSKYGLQPEQVPGFIQSLTGFDTLRLRGLMTLAVFSADEAQVRTCFQRMQRLHSDLTRLLDLPTDNLAEDHLGLSMGMSGDFEVAIEEGATVVRVGQALFGPRELPDSYYWPTQGS